MTDRFAHTGPSLSGPASFAFSITPHDSKDLREMTRALYIGAGGNLCVTTMSGDTVTMMSVLPGSVLPLRVVRVLQTGTTAGNIVGLA